MFINAASSCGDEALAALQAEGGMSFDSIQQALDFHRARSRHQRLLDAPADAAPPAPDFTQVLAQAKATPAGLLTEWQAKQWLA